jgi:L-ascorbate metabolism protein UlaG (beta-lactamase superfamily)
MTEPLVITRITHSCHLIQIGGLTVLTDPWSGADAGRHNRGPVGAVGAGLQSVRARGPRAPLPISVFTPV